MATAPRPAAHTIALAAMLALVPFAPRAAAAPPAAPQPAPSLRGAPAGIVHPAAPAEIEFSPLAVVDRGTRFVIGSRHGGDRAHAYDRARVTAVRGAAPGVPGSHAFLVRSPSGTRGYVEIDGARRWIGAETDAGARGASPDVLEPSGVAGRTEASFGPIVAPTIGPERTPDSRERQAFTRPAVAAACGMRTLGQDADEDMLMADGEAVATRSELGAPTLPPNTTRVVEVAVDTDYELFSLIGDVDATIDYLVELYSAISDIYLRETNTRIVLTYVRVWDTPDDLFNEPDPLTPFVNWWNANMQAVPRDVAQLVSGRRNLPWGGVAYLSAACGNFGYSVVGYALGFIPDLSVPNIYDFDVPVCAHELGHNLGALHTHSYGLDNCDQLANTPQRGTIMSYCSQTVSGGNTVTDLRFGTFVAGKIIEFLETAPCLHADCDGDGVADYSQIQANLSLDINRNIRLDGCEDCNGDGVPDAVELDGAWDCWVANQFEDGAVRRMHAQTGVLAGVSEKGVVSMANDLVITPDRRVLVSSGADDRVAELAPDGSFVGDLVGPGVGGLDEPAGLLLKPDGTLLVASRKTHSVLRYSLATGAFLGAFVPAHSGGLVSPFGLAFGPDGHLYVNGADNRVRRYDGATGTFLGILVGSAANGGLGDPRGMVFLPDGRLVVASRATNALLSYDGATGAFLGKFNKGGTTTALTFDEPWGVRIGPNGNLFAVRHDPGDPVGAGGGLLHDDLLEVQELHVNSSRIYEFDIQSGIFLRSYVTGHDTQLWAPTGLDFMPGSATDCNRNGVPDGCDIAEGVLADVDHDGIADACDDAIALLGDLDGDGDVDGGDLGLLLGGWGTCAPSARLGGPCVGDLDGNGSVDGADLGALLGAWS
ncbi:MAG: M12 family metallo-peptidase [Phycisphaerales bacterium]